MNAGIDFIALYRELGIQPECSPDEFKRAYRKRVSELHPDRFGDGTDSEEALKTLNSAYAVALDFHRMHGRFPGAAPPPRDGNASTRTVASVPRPEAIGQEATRREPAREDEPPPHRSSAWMRLLLLSLLIVFVASQLELCNGDDTASGEEASQRPHATTTRPQPIARLQLGMLPGEVMSILGVPTETSEHGELWMYGPSWVRVSCGQVADWYSSPLKPLAASRAHPGPDDAREGYGPRVGCGTRTGYAPD